MNRRFLKCSKKGEFYNNVMRLREFVEELKEIDRRLNEVKNITLKDLKKLGINDLFINNY